MQRSKSGKLLVVLMGLVFLAAITTSCATTSPGEPWNKQQKGTAWGAGIGAAAGAATGAIFKGGKGALWGALGGLLLGGLAGNQIGAYMDRQQAAFEQALAESEAASIRREGENLRITFKGDVYFETNSFQINPRMFSELDRVASILVQYPQTWIEVGGHADQRGSDAFNLQLSQQRADAVARELNNRGVQAERIRAIGYGESQPLSGGNPDMFSIDRRVEIRLLPMRQG